MVTMLTTLVSDYSSFKACAPSITKVSFLLGQAFSQFFPVWFLFDSLCLYYVIISNLFTFFFKFLGEFIRILPTFLSNFSHPSCCHSSVAVATFSLQSHTQTNLIILPSLRQFFNQEAFGICILYLRSFSILSSVVEELGEASAALVVSNLISCVSLVHALHSWVWFSLLAFYGHLLIEQPTFWDLTLSAAQGGKFKLLQQEHYGATQVAEINLKISWTTLIQH